MIAIDPLGQNRRRRLAERTPHALEADGADSGFSRHGPEVQRDDIAAPGIAARHAGVRVQQRPAVTRAVVVIDQPSNAGLAIPLHYGFSIGAFTVLPHSVHEPS